MRRNRMGTAGVVGTALAVLVVVCLGASAVDSPYRPGPGGYPRFGAKTAEPGLHYGRLPDFPLPKTLLYSVSADELPADGDAWLERGYRGFFLRGVCGEWSSDPWAVDGKPWTIGPSDATLRKVRQATAACKKAGAEVFLTGAFSHSFVDGKARNGLM